jgi:plastocyanin
MAQYTVTIKDMEFDPASIPVKVGDQIVWNNTDSTRHTATADDGPVPDTGNIPPRTMSKPQTFSAAGTIPYHCTVHSTMTAEVVVTV